MRLANSIALASAGASGSTFDFVSTINGIGGGPLSFLRVTQASDATGLTDLSGNGNGATSDSADATFTASGGAGGKPGLTFNGTSNRYAYETGINSNNLTVIAALVQGTGLGDQCLLGTQSSSRALLLNRSGNVAVYDSAFVTFGARSNTSQILTWKLDATGTESEMFRNGVSLGTGAYDGVFWPFNAGSKLGALAGPTWYADMTFSALALWDSVLSDPDLAAAHAAFATEYS